MSRKSLELIRNKARVKDRVRRTPLRKKKVKEIQYSNLNKITSIFDEELFVMTYKKYLQVKGRIHRQYKSNSYFAFAIKMFLRLFHIIIKDMIDNYNQFEFENYRFYIGKGDIKKVRINLLQEKYYEGVDWDKQSYRPNQFKVKYKDKEGNVKVKFFNIPKPLYKYLVETNKVYIKD